MQFAPPPRVLFGPEEMEQSAQLFGGAGLPYRAESYWRPTRAEVRRFERKLGVAALHVHHRREGPFGEGGLAVLRAVLPSFKAGLDALCRLGAHRHAVGEPVAVFSPDGRELHRTPALVSLLAGDPERERVERALGEFGRRARRYVGGPPQGSGPPVGDGPPPARASAQTTRGRYALRATALPPGPFGPDPAVLVTVSADRAPAAPTPEAVRERHGLTAREAEVALLLAEGLRNGEVAERLCVSPHTVRRHVENVLAKLEVPGRAAVVAKLLAA